MSRVAANGAATGVYSFNSGLPPTDAITPLGFAHLIGGLGAVFGTAPGLGHFEIARWLGLGCSLLSFFLAGAWIGADNPRRGWWWGAPLSALCLPAAAWAGAGLATPIVGLFVIVGARCLTCGRVVLGGLLLGCATAWRPELVPFALALGLVTLRTEHVSRRDAARTGLAFILPNLVVVCVRWVAFGAAIPLAAIAKAPDPRSGAFYATMTLIWGGLSWLLLFRSGAWTERRALPWVVHLVALFFAGGDWMPALRLSAPLYPWMVWAVGSELRVHKPFLVALLPAIGFPAALQWSQGSDWRLVEERRTELLESNSAKSLQQSETVAAVDIGWVGMVTPARIVDLAGVTDPTIARLPGGHTSKAISPGLFSDRDVDTWVIRALDRSYQPGDPLEMLIAAYLVDARLLRKNSDMGFVGVATIPLEGTSGQYVIARRLEVARKD